MKLNKRRKFFLEVFGICIGATIIFGNFVTLAIVLGFFVIWVIAEVAWSIKEFIRNWRAKKILRRHLRGE